MATPTTSDFLVVPINGTDLIAFYRGSNISRPLYLSYSNFLAILTQAISGGAPLLLQTNSVQNPTQSILNLINGPGISITDNGLGGITITATGGGGGTYTVDNGLTESPANNFQLGGTLIQNTTINGSIYQLNLTSVRTSGDATLNVVNTSTGNGIRIDSEGIGVLSINLSSANAKAIVGQSKNGRGGSFISTNSIAAEFTTSSGISAADFLIGTPSDDTSIFSALRIFRSQASSLQNNSGSSIAFYSQNDTKNTANIIARTTSVTLGSEVGQIELQTKDSTSAPSTTLTLKGTGQLQLNKYTAPFSGTAVYSLGVDASGNVITFTGGGGGSSLNDTTGILFGGALSATIGGTTFSVTAGIGQIITQTASITGVVTTASNVTWSAVTGAAITNIATSQFTYVLVNSSGTVIQQTAPFTDAQYKTHIIIGILCHINLASVNLVTNSQNVAYEDPHRLVELITSFGPIKKLGLNIAPNGVNLRVNRTSGEAFKIGTNYITDQFEPDVSNIAAQTPALLCRVHRDGSGGFIFDVNGGLYYNDIDPDQYDDGSGTLQSVGGSKWTIQRLFFFPNNPVDIICYYGVQVYNQFSEARANLEFETFDEATITAENAVFLGFLFVRNAATDLSDPNEAVFLQSGLFRGIPPGGGGSGGGGNSIGELTGDVTTPAATAPSQSVVATIANNAVTYAKMQAVNTARILGRNTAGVGNIEELSAIPNGITATTQSALDNSNKIATTAYVDNAVDDIDYLLTYSFKSTYNY